MLTLITAGIGLITTILAWYLNPGRKKNLELNAIFKELDQLYSRRDVALETNDNDSLTIITDRINILHKRKNYLLQ